RTCALPIWVRPGRRCWRGPSLQPGGMVTAIAPTQDRLDHEVGKAPTYRRVLWASAPAEAMGAVAVRESRRGMEPRGLAGGMAGVFPPAPAGSAPSRPGGRL